MDWRWLSFSLSDGSALQINQGALPTQGEAMQATTINNGSAEYRVAQAIEEEKVSHARQWPWSAIIETMLILVALSVLVWSLFK